MVILFNPPSSANRKPVLPMSLLALGQVLEQEHDYLIIDGNLETDPVATLDRAIRETGARILAVTVMPGPQLSHAVPVCRELKSRHPDLVVVWGGYFPTQHFDVCLRAPYVDYVTRGHAELAFKNLVEAIASGDDPASLPGVASLDRVSGEIVDNGLPPIPHPRDLPPLFPYHRLEMSRYVRATFMGERTLPHHSSYGCPFRCNFCAVVNMVDGAWKAQTASQAEAVVRHLSRNWNADAVEFYDNNFFTDESRVAEFAERILDLEVSWWGEARIDTLLRYSDRTWELMQRSGLKMVFLGAESGSDETLKRMDKGGTATTEKTLLIAEKMARYDIVPELSFVLGNPPDPEADTLQTIEFIRRVKQVNRRSEIVMYMYTPVPLSGELYERATDAGFRFPETLEEWLSPAWQAFSQHRSTEMPWLRGSLRRRVRDFESVLNAYYPTVTNPRLGGAWRGILKATSAWRYHLRLYGRPLELRALMRVVSYQRPETTGF